MDNLIINKVERKYSQLYTYGKLLVGKVNVTLNFNNAIIMFK